MLRRAEGAAGGRGALRRGCRRGARARAGARSGGSSAQVALGHEPKVEYYEFLGVSPSASQQEIKRAFKEQALACHPDRSLDESAHDHCVLLNEAYDVLSDPTKREAYDRWRAEYACEQLHNDDGFTGELLSKWCGPGHPLSRATDPNESRGVFVDEATCIGCQNCLWCAPATFRIEPEFGRARVFAQWVNTEEEIQEAIDSCPVSCIWMVNKEDLPALEFTMRYKTPRPNVGVMMGGSLEPPDVFTIAQEYIKQREHGRQERERRWMQEREQAYEQSDMRHRSRRRMRLFAGLWRHVLESTGLARVVEAFREAPFFSWAEEQREHHGDSSSGSEGVIPMERALVRSGGEGP